MGYRDWLAIGFLSAGVVLRAQGIISTVAGVAGGWRLPGDCDDWGAIGECTDAHGEALASVLVRVTFDSMENSRSHECERGTQECVRRVVVAQFPGRRLVYE